MATEEKNVSQLAFHRDLWDCFDQCFQRLTKGRHDIKMLNTYMKERAQVEGEYAKSLLKITKKPSFSVEDSTLSKCWEDAKQAAQNMSTQHLEFKKTCLGIHKKLESTINEMKIVKTRAQQQFHKLSKERDSRSNKHNKAQDAYIKSVKDGETASEAFNAGQAQGLPGPKLGKLEKAFKNSKSNLDKCHRAYKQSVEALREAEIAYDNGLAASLQEMESCERRRLEEVQQQLKLYAQQHSFVSSSLDQTHLRLMDGIEKVSIEDDITEFVQKNKTNNTPPPHVVYRPERSQILGHEVDYVSTDSPPAYGDVKQPDYAPAAQTANGPPNMAPGDMWCVAIYDFEAAETQDLGFRQGDYIKLLECDDNADWWKGELNGQTGILPKVYVERVESDPIAPTPTSVPIAPVPTQEPSPVTPSDPYSQQPTASTAPPSPMPAGPTQSSAAPAPPQSSAAPSATEEPTVLNNARCVAEFDFDGLDADELSFNAGDVLIITGEMNGWYFGRTESGDRVGIFPCGYVKLQT